MYMPSRFQWLRGLRRRSVATRWLGLRVRMLPGAWMSVSCECCVLSGRGLCDGLIIRPEESYRMWCVCDREALTMKRRPWPDMGFRATGKKMYVSRPYADNCRLLPCECIM
jgi:hypothetical protein